MDNESRKSSKENVVTPISGWPMLVVFFGLMVLGVYNFIYTVANANEVEHIGWRIAGSIVCVLAAMILVLPGFFTLQPNEARVLILFGAYRGTVRVSGFHWANPFYAKGVGINAAGKPTFNKYKMSLRVRNFNSDKIKVNDKRGNPIEIAAVVVWRVEDTAQASFDVDDYENYVRVQSESALRHLASSYAYANGEDNELTLQSSADEISVALRSQLQERLHKAGVVVDEARLTHLAYAPEIAQAMLRRQQAEAVIAARTKIVAGAVSMVDMALKELSERHVVELDPERRAAMVSNLMVVLCGESEVHPIVNTGTLYT